MDCSPSTENSEQHNLLEQLQSRYRQMEERITCPICIDNHIKLVFQCGHASCIECSAALKTCPICRQTIRERIQLFVWNCRGPLVTLLQSRSATLLNSLVAPILVVPLLSKIRNLEDSNRAPPPIICPSVAAFSGCLLPIILSGPHCLQGCAVVSLLSQSRKGWSLCNSCSFLYKPHLPCMQGETHYICMSLCIL